MQKKRWTMDVVRRIVREIFGFSKDRKSSAKQIKLTLLALFFITVTSALIFAANSTLDGFNLESPEFEVNTSTEPSASGLLIPPSNFSLSDFPQSQAGDQIEEQINLKLEDNEINLEPQDNETGSKDNETLTNKTNELANKTIKDSLGDSLSEEGLGVLPILPIILPVIPENSSENDTLAENLSEIEIDSPSEPTNIIKTVLRLIINTISAVVGELIRIQATLTYENDTPISGKQINFYSNRYSNEYPHKYLGSNLTDIEGKASIEWDTSRLLPGFYFLTANFSGEGNLAMTSAAVNLFLSNSNKTDAADANNSLENDSLELELPKIENLTTENLTIGNLTLLSIYTEKKNYTQNEIINIFGEWIVNGKRMDAKASLEIVFNENRIFTSNINVTEGSYSYSLPVNFEDEGEYLIRIFGENLSAETNFYMSKNASILDLGDIFCEEFEENILWSSGYSLNLKGSTNYQTWYPQHNCTRIGEQNCFLGKVEIQTRFLYFGESNEQGEGYIQISNPDESICGNPEQGIYSGYLAYETLYGESKRLGQYCGSNKNLNAKCGIEIAGGFENTAACYGIKSRATKSFLVDAFKVKYTLCLRGK